MSSTFPLVPENDDAQSMPPVARLKRLKLVKSKMSMKATTSKKKGAPPFCFATLCLLCNSVLTLKSINLSIYIELSILLILDSLAGLLQYRFVFGFVGA